MADQQQHQQQPQQLLPQQQAPMPPQGGQGPLQQHHHQQQPQQQQQQQQQQRYQQPQHQQHQHQQPQQQQPQPQPQQQPQQQQQQHYQQQQRQQRQQRPHQQQQHYQQPLPQQQAQMPPQGGQGPQQQAVAAQNNPQPAHRNRRHRRGNYVAELVNRRDRAQQRVLQELAHLTHVTQQLHSSQAPRGGRDGRGRGGHVEPQPRRARPGPRQRRRNFLRDQNQQQPAALPFRRAPAQPAQPPQPAPVQAAQQQQDGFIPPPRGGYPHRYNAHVDSESDVDLDENDRPQPARNMRRDQRPDLRGFNLPLPDAERPEDQPPVYQAVEEQAGAQPLPYRAQANNNEGEKPAPNVVAPAVAPTIVAPFPARAVDLAALANTKPEPNNVVGGGDAPEEVPHSNSTESGLNGGTETYHIG